MCFFSENIFLQSQKKTWSVHKRAFYSLNYVQGSWNLRRNCFLSLKFGKQRDYNHENDKKRLKLYSLKNMNRGFHFNISSPFYYDFSKSSILQINLFKTKYFLDISKMFFHIKSQNLSTHHSGSSVYNLSPSVISSNGRHYSEKEILLLSTSNFFERLKIRMKYCLMKQIRPFNVDDISAMFTWIIACNILWVIIGTTTFFSLVLMAINSVFAQEYLATKIGEYLTKETGITIVFESAIVPKWRDGTISFKNVFISRRPYNQNVKNNVRKGTVLETSSVTALNNTNSSDSCLEENVNYVLFDLMVEDINVVFSFVKWFNGTGIIKDIDIKGVRGVIDGSKIYTDEGNTFLDPRSFRRNHQLGDFEIENFRLKNVLVTVYQPKEFRPFTISIYDCELPRLRKQWLLYDILNANTISGSYDNSLFTLHPRQTFFNKFDEKDRKIKETRLRIDNVNIDHLNKGVNGPFGWITHGYVDFVLDFIFPDENKDINFTKVMHNIVDNIETAFIQQKDIKEEKSFITQDSNRIFPKLLCGLVRNTSLENSETFNTEEMIIDIKMTLHGVKASVPLFAKELSYVSNALIRPIIAYINSHHAYIPITCRVIKNLDDFNGSWTIYDSRLINDLSEEIYKELAKMVVDQDVKRYYIRTVSVWSLERALHTILSGLKNIAPPVKIYT
ncbi:hypothetical protein PORY_000365 [Pneumocystis oryctolagi]|uniref:Uncharacterized protein n=1 Tax=Pneumocystis oryctolagi TaxID=42067 RepID=A0ACB7CF07_9ASCO|nr:hypothetical protein PORY_000365 [Pneumocystis oryctolagi]